MSSAICGSSAASSLTSWVDAQLAVAAFDHVVHRNDDDEVDRGRHQQEVDHRGEEKTPNRTSAEGQEIVEVGLSHQQRKMSGIMTLLTSASTTELKAAPMMTATARSMTLPLRMNFLNPVSMRTKLSHTWARGLSSQFEACRKPSRHRPFTGTPAPLPARSTPRVWRSRASACPRPPPPRCTAGARTRSSSP